jgi:multidrug efflux pump
VADALRKDKAVSGVAAFIGAGSINPTLNQGQVSIVLKPRGERGSLEDVVARLQRDVADIPGVALYLKPVQDITLDTRVSATEYQYAMSDVDSDELGTYAARMTEAMRQLPELADVDNNLADKGNALHLQIDRDKASRLGVPVQTIDDTLYDAFGQRQISTIFTQLNQYRVVLEVAPRYRNSNDLLNKLTVRSNGSGALTGSNATSYGMLRSANSATATGIGQANTGIPLGSGSTVPLSSLVSAKVENAPLVISHQNQLPAVTISFNLAPGYSLSQAVDAIHKAEANLHAPASVQAQFIGKAAEFFASLGDEVLLLLAAIVVIYIVLGVLYESYIHPLTIISTLPPAGVGALLALMIFGMSLSVDGIVGIILLIGIVKKNAIMMIDFALARQRADNLPANEAIFEACLVRFRPIMMTTMAALLGTLPIAIAFGAGAEARQPLGLAVVGGLLVSQLLTLYLTPVIYVYLDRLSHWRPFRRGGAVTVPAE